MPLNHIISATTAPQKPPIQEEIKKITEASDAQKDSDGMEKIGKGELGSSYDQMYAKTFKISPRPLLVDFLMGYP